MNFSRFLKSPSAAGLSPPRRPRGWGERKRESATIPSSPARFLLEPLRKREEVGFETGRRISFGSLQLEKTATIQATRKTAQALSENVETFLSSTVEKYFALAENWMKYLSIAKAYEREICLVKKNFTKVALLTIFASINEFIIVKEQLIWLFQILLANISGHCCPSYIGLVTFFTYLEATHLSVFHRCSTRSSCNNQ